MRCLGRGKVSGATFGMFTKHKNCGGKRLKGFSGKKDIDMLYSRKNYDRYGLSAVICDEYALSWKR